VCLMYDRTIYRTLLNKIITVSGTNKCQVLYHVHTSTCWCHLANNVGVQVMSQICPESHVSSSKHYTVHSLRCCRVWVQVQFLTVGVSCFGQPKHKTDRRSSKQLNKYHTFTGDKPVKVVSPCHHGNAWSSWLHMGTLTTWSPWLSCSFV